MNRSFQPLGLVARAIALTAAIACTSLIVAAHDADLSTLGGHDVTVAAKWPDATSSVVANAH